MQVDWVSGEVSSEAILRQGIKLYDTGKVAELTPDGEVKVLRANFMAFEGSHDNRLAICSRDPASVYVSGNPAKFFQGHNLFGSTDVDGLFLSAGIAIRMGVGLFPGPETFASCEFTRPRYTRIDLTRSYRFTSNDRARAWLRDVASSARTRHGSAGLGKDGSVTFGKGSRRWSFTIYPKFDELEARGRGHALSKSLDAKAAKRLQEWACGVVRFELRLRALELAAGAWPITSPLATWSEYFERIQFNRNNLASMEVDMVMQAMPQHLLGYLARWKVGEDLRAQLSKPTYYRVRRDLLNAAGVDIASPPVKAEHAFTAGTLPAGGWAPEPITEYLYEPGDELKRSYGLL